MDARVPDSPRPDTHGSTLSTTSTQSSNTLGENHHAVSTHATNEKPRDDVEQQGQHQEAQDKKQKTPWYRSVISQTLITDAVLHHQYKGSGTEEDPYVVEYIENDPRNPMEFSQIRKWFIVLTVAIATLAVAFVSSAYSGGIKEVLVEFQISEELGTAGVSLFVLGFAVGPLVWAPMSELYGRQILFTSTYMMLTVFNAGAAGSNSAATLLILRFLAGTFGSSPLTNAGGVIADMMSANQRGIGMAVFAAAPFLGPVIGPIVGGFVGETIGWRWIEGIMAIFTGTLWIFGTLTIPETYSPVILRRRAKKLSKMTGKHYISILEKQQGKTTPKAAFQKSIARPWILLLREPIVLLISIYMAIIYGTLYMCFSAFPIVYQQGRGWSQGIGGLAFLGVCVGMLLGVSYAVWDNKRYMRVEDEHDGEAPPESRLPPAMVGAIALPIGLFWFAWTNGPSIHWIVSIIATAPFGFGMVLVFLACMNYLIDSYTIYAASVLAANSVLRSLFGAGFPLFTSYMFQNLGIHWAASIPAFLALICAPFPFVFYKVGEKIRLKCKYARSAHEIMEKMKDNQEEVANEEPRDEDEKNDENSENDQPGDNTVSRTTTGADRPDATRMLSKKESRASQASRREQRARREPFGRVYSHASHHHY